MGNARLSGANLGGAELQGADLRGAKLQGADLTDAEIWLASFPGNLAEQTPAPLGVANLKMSPPEADAKAKLKTKLQTITDAKLLERLMERLEPILRNVPPNWEDEDSWREYIRQANEPPPEELAQLLGQMACGDSKGDVSQEIARRAIAKELARKVLNRRSKQTPSYVKPLAQALLSTNCEGAKALADESRAKLRVLGGIDNLIRHGNVLVDRGDYDGAIADYDKVLAATPDDAIALNGRAWAYAQKGELDKALAGAERAVRLNPEDANTVHTRAWIYLNKGSLDLALTEFDKALSLDAELAGAYADRGRTYELKGERDKAIADYRKALSLKSQRTYDDKAKAEASRHLIALGENVGSDGEEVAPPSAPQAPGKF
jgi:tetratricopeptide (TPR) repeat protein